LRQQQVQGILVAALAVLARRPGCKASQRTPRAVRASAVPARTRAAALRPRDHVVIATEVSQSEYVRTFEWREEASMALLEDVFGNGVGGPATVVGAVVLGSLLLPAAAGAARPVVKMAIKGGIMAYGQWREALAGVGAIVNETVAEARAELESGAVAEERARQKGGGRSGPRDSKAGNA
jgi:hypothetical protein